MFLDPTVVHSECIKRCQHALVFSRTNLPVEERRSHRAMGRVVLRHYTDRSMPPERRGNPAERFLAAGNIIRQHQVPDDESALHNALLVCYERGAHLPVHLNDRCMGMPAILLHLRVLIPHGIIIVLQVWQVDVDDAIKEAEHIQRIVSIGVVDDWHPEPVRCGAIERHDNLWNEVRG